MAQHASTIALRLVSATEADRDQLATLINAAFDVYPFMGGPRTSPEGIAEEAGTTGVFVVAEDAGGIVGCAMLRPAIEVGWDLDAPPPGLAAADVMYLGLVCVDPTIHRSGLGKRIMTEAELAARNRGFGRVALGTLSEQGNVPYYEAIGYRTVASQQFEAGHWDQTIAHRFCVMVKDLVSTTLRLAIPGDAAAIAAIVNLAYEVEDFFKVGDRTDVAEIEQLLATDAFLVADAANGELAGAVYVRSNPPRGYFGMLSVHPATQGTGLGRKLVEAAEHRCSENGCTDMDLSVVNLRTELPAFYQRLGYSISGTEPWPEDELHRISRPAHFITMTRRIESSAPARR